MNEYKVLHLFSGIGGAALGFQWLKQNGGGIKWTADAYIATA